MADVEFTWKAAEVTKLVQKVMVPKLERIGAELRSHVVKKISAGKTRADGPSKGGDPPHKDFGQLAQEIFHEVDPKELSVSVFTTVNYGFWLEVGTTKMEARPFLRTSLEEMRAQIRKIITS